MNESQISATRPDLLILVTRFNWPHEKWASVDESEYRAWLEERVKAFAGLTVPSVNNCTKKPDYWYVLCSSLENFGLRQKLEGLLGGLPFKLVEYSGKSLTATIAEQLSTLVFPVRVRMTRLDSDDLIAADYFARLKSVPCDEDEGSRGLVVSFPGGCNFVQDENCYYYSSYPDNPFLSLVEDLNEAEEARTVYHRMHTEMLSAGFAVRFVRSFRPMWASVLHGSTTQNQSLAQTNQIALADSRLCSAIFGCRAD